ncbi:hypothetical protein [Caulobacter sp. SSI4214]|uniref:hypothetical protein n=1 Tax=Caulobacter sp. SSI4214 TaxID=2575739 RepID=UPI00143A2A51|nr:hypothetical protein [Caulobacter sp. SSI4214]
MVSIGRTYRAWVFVAALGLIAVTSGLQAQAEQTQTNQRQKSNSSTYPAQPSAPVSAPINAVRRTPIYKPDCKSPRDSNEYALCVSVKSLESANHQVMLGWLQFIGLVITVSFTAYSLNIAKRALMNVERAWLHVCRYEGNMIAGKFVVQPVWQNSGSTPATKTVFRCAWKSFEAPLTSHYTFPDLDSSGNETSKFSDYAISMIGPGAETFATGIAIEPHFISEISSGNCHIYIWGWAEYNDVLFRPRHRTEFAVKLEAVPDPNPENPGRVAMRFIHHWEHNGVDSDCLKRTDKWPGNPAKSQD